MSKKNGVVGLYLLTFFSLCFSGQGADAARPVKPAAHTPAYIAIIIDDLGYHLGHGQRVVALPGPVACAILPHTRHSRALATQAHKSGKEILLHLPMQSFKDREPGPGKLVSGMPSLELALTVQYNLENVPHAVGINNHMGSELTQDQQAMGQLMQAMKQHPELFFVDSVTSPHSVAAKMARQHHIPNLSRDIFLDNERSTAAINAQVHKLIRLAKKRGYALAIGHPYPVTLAVLEKWLPILDTYQVKLVPLIYINIATTTGASTMTSVLVPLAQGTEELEAVTIIDLLRRANIEVITAGLEAGPVTASRHTVLLPDTTLDQVLDKDFDMIVLPGGLPGATNLQQDSRILELLKKMATKGKYVAAICAAPKVLSTAGLLQGKRATCFPGSLSDQEAIGIELQDTEVIVDGTIITSRGPGTAMDFSLQLIQLLQGEETRNKVEQSLQRPKGHTTNSIKVSA